MLYIGNFVISNVKHLINAVVESNNNNMLLYCTIYEQNFTFLHIVFISKNHCPKYRFFPCFPLRNVTTENPPPTPKRLIDVSRGTIEYVRLPG